jgi:xanthine dehydrogenase YagR molybdenum-binding subunit
VEYETLTQHHNPIDLFATACAWDGPKVAVYEPSQTVGGLQHGLAQQLGMDPSNVRVISPYVGGAFGSKASVTPRTVLVALAARVLGRPVKLVASRDQGFTISTYRAETRHRIRLGASRDGKLRVLWHEAYELTSRADDYFVAGTETTPGFFKRRISIPRFMSYAPTAARPDSCVRRSRSPTCLHSKARWMNSP